jgi:hypothetical protein
VKRTKTEQGTGHIVRDYYIGNTHCIVCDNYCRDKTKEETEAILKRVAANALRSLNTNAVHNETA